MPKVNIGGDSHDTNYRYKRDLLEIKYENNYGGQTRLLNIKIISKQLQIPAEKILKFFSQSLGLPIKNDMIRGAPQISTLEQLLQNFIQKTLICPECKIPEWNGKNCNACGYSSTKQIKETEEIAEEPVAKGDVIISDMMKHLYNLRDSQYSSNVVELSERCEILDEMLDACWKKETKDLKKARKLIGKINDALEKYGFETFSMVEEETKQDEQNTGTLTTKSKYLFDLNDSSIISEEFRVKLVLP